MGTLEIKPIAQEVTPSFGTADEDSNANLPMQLRRQKEDLINGIIMEKPNVGLVSVIFPFSKTKLAGLPPWLK